MFFKTSILVSTATVLAMLALFVFLLMAISSPECKCPKGFTESQCNFTNVVCLTQTMFVKGDIHEPVNHVPTHHRPSDITKKSKVDATDDEHSNFEDDTKLRKEDTGLNDRNLLVSNVNFVKPDHVHVIKEDVDPKTSHGLNSYLFIYNLYPVILVVMAAVLSAPSVFWTYVSLENDIYCLINTLTFAGSDDADEKSQMKCVEQLVRDFKFFLRCFERNLYNTVRKMYILRVILPLLELITLTFVFHADLVSVFNPLTSLQTVYSIGQRKFPSCALCHFRIVTRSASSAYTTSCSLPASPLLQLLTPLIMLWLILLVLHGLYSCYTFSKIMSSSSQHKFYRRHGFNLERAQSPKKIFGNGGFLLFTTVSKSDTANIMPQVLNNLRTTLADRFLMDEDVEY